MICFGSSILMPPSPGAWWLFHSCKWLRCTCITQHIRTSICSPGKGALGTRLHELPMAAIKFFVSALGCVEQASCTGGPVSRGPFSREQPGKCLCVGVCTWIESYPYKIPTYRCCLMPEAFIRLVCNLHSEPYTYG